MLNNPQDQKVEQGGIAIQAKESVEAVTIHQINNNGLTAEEVRAVANDAFRAEFYRFLDHAGDIATARAQKVLENYLDRIQKEQPASLEQANDPAFRYALLNAQKAHAISGDENLEPLLVELLVERTAEAKRSLRQIVISEALEVIGKLTDEQIQTLSIAFLIHRGRSENVLSFENWLLVMDQFVAPLLPIHELSDTSFSHLEFVGCGTVSLNNSSLAAAFLHSYSGVWQRGFPNTEKALQELTIHARSFIVNSEHHPGYLRVLDGATELSLSRRERLFGDKRQLELLQHLLNYPRLNEEEVKSRCLQSRGYMSNLFDIWDNSTMRRFTPSAVGVAIAHANLKRVVSNLGPLSIWIN